MVPEIICAPILLVSISQSYCTVTLFMMHIHFNHIQLDFFFSFRPNNGLILFVLIFISYWPIILCMINIHTWVYECACICEFGCYVAFDNLQIISDISRPWYVPHHVGGHIGFGADPVGVLCRRSLLSALDLLNEWMDFDQTCIQIHHLVGVKYWDFGNLYPIFKVTRGLTISVIICLCMYVLVKCLFLNSRLANFGERNCPFGFLLVCFDCSTCRYFFFFLSTSFFPFGVLDGRL